MQNRLVNNKNIELNKLADYNTLLVKETNHRVSNNLALLVGIIKIKISRTQDPNLIRTLSDIESRIMSIASTHKNIYQSPNYAELKTGKILEEIISNQLNLIQPHLLKNISYEIDDIKLEISTIIPLTMIINELLTNSIKYALKTSDDFIKISLKPQTKTNQITLIVEDSGKGFDIKQKDISKNSIGIYLTQLLTKQISGKIETVKNENSFKIILTLPA